MGYVGTICEAAKHGKHIHLLRNYVGCLHKKLVTKQIHVSRVPRGSQYRLGLVKY